MPTYATLDHLSCTMERWRGQRPYRVTFKISLMKDEPTLLSGANCLSLGLIKWLGSVNTTKNNPKNKKKKSTNTIPKVPQGNSEIVTSLEQLKTLYPDLIYE